MYVFPFFDNGFNPRAREGRDQNDNIEIIDYHIVSIHAPARGATFSAFSAASCWSCFNPRAREGRDCILHSAEFLLLCFNPRAREGRDDRIVRILLFDYRLNPRAREGRDQSMPNFDTL